ncbi:MFS transporter [Ectopseudomonas mendocina]|uniref:MFS transporter n=1 Tax=Ectopseudomonas mendocina TaxID=300 RepID=A0ABZ2RHP6_ECTME
MTRLQQRRRLAFEWWLLLLAIVLPVLVLNTLFGDNFQHGKLTMPVFMLGLISMFVSLPMFHRYKHALIATGKSFDSEGEPAAWQALAQVRRKAILVGALPAWIAAAAVFAGLEAVPLILLTVASLVILYLYRTPRQLA